MANKKIKGIEVEIEENADKIKLIKAKIRERLERELRQVRERFGDMDREELKRMEHKFRREEHNFKDEFTPKTLGQKDPDNYYSKKEIVAAAKKVAGGKVIWGKKAGVRGFIEKRGGVIE